MYASTHPFAGPLFVVGNARSGTKVLRDLLNRNPRISICDPETHFIPYLYQKHRMRLPFKDCHSLDRFFCDFNRTPFQIFNRGMGQPCMSRRDFAALMSAESWSDAFEKIIRFYCEQGDAADAIWGDKTPSYLTEMPLLKEIFPEARFVHIIRDPRDVALSAQRAWGHSLYRIASKWERNVAAARRDGAALGYDYLEVFYENLVREPERELRRVCTFVGCDYFDGMTTLLRPSENIGDAKGKAFIVSSNVKKYISKMTPHEQKRVEEIVLPTAVSLGYRLDYAERHLPLRDIERTFFMLIDGAKSAIRYIRKKGVVDGFRIIYGNRIQKFRR